MLVLVTGQPGNGKTLHTLGLVEQLRLDPKSVALNREVYYSGIPELTLPWKPLEKADEWHKLPDGSIVVIDECQRIFPPRKQGSVVPESVRQFETHRHRGFDIFLITQHPQLLDINVRKLCGRHVHLKRTFGQEVATVLQWEECKDPNDRSARSTALVSKFQFPKERYAWYKSAELHTVQKKLPWKPIAIAVGGLVGVVVLFAWAFMRLTGPKVEQFTEAKAILEGDSSAEVSGSKKRGIHLSEASLVPQVEYWPWTAELYSEVARIASPPRVSGCLMLQIGDYRQCRCANGQGGEAQVGVEVCRDYMAGKVFDPLKPYQDAKAANIAYLNARDSGGQGQESRSTAEGEPASSRQGGP